MYKNRCEICKTCWEILWLRKDKIFKLSIETHLSFLEVYLRSFQLISFQKKVHVILMLDVMLVVVFNLLAMLRKITITCCFWCKF